MIPTVRANGGRWHNLGVATPACRREGRNRIRRLLWLPERASACRTDPMAGQPLPRGGTDGAGPSHLAVRLLTSNVAVLFDGLRLLVHENVQIVRSGNAGRHCRPTVRGMAISGPTGSTTLY